MQREDGGGKGPCWEMKPSLCPPSRPAPHLQVVRDRSITCVCFLNSVPRAWGPVLEVCAAAESRGPLFAHLSSGESSPCPRGGSCGPLPPPWGPPAAIFPAHCPAQLTARSVPGEESAASACSLAPPEGARRPPSPHSWHSWPGILGPHPGGKPGSSGSKQAVHRGLGARLGLLERGEHGRGALPRG